MSTPFDTPVKDIVVKLASEKSASYMLDLALAKASAERQNIDAARANIEGWLVNRSQSEVSDEINRLKGLGYVTGYSRMEKTTFVAAPLPSLEEVPEGHYALPTEEGAKNSIAFYNVQRPTEGRWAGYVFASRYSSDEEIKLGRDGSHRLIRKIAEYGAEASSALYGREKKRCGICHRKLTNDDSRARGIGPDCAEKLGW